MSRKQKKMLLRIILAVVLSAAAFAVKRMFGLNGMAELALFAVPYVIAGYDVIWAAVRNIFRGQVFDEKFLMTAATAGAFAISEYPEAAAVMIFYQIGELFQNIAVGKSRRSIAELMDIRPDYAVVLRGEEEQKVSPEEIKPGETIIVRPGEKIPLDGEITDGTTSVNTSSLTGESVPVDKLPGDSVISGCINLTGVITVRVRSTYSESTVARVLELVENSAEKKARVESFITRFARWYTPGVVIGALLLAVLPPLLMRQQWGEWINRALIFLVVSCPCALVVSVPLSFFGGIGAASKRGILIKGANYLEALAGADTVVFDKTGTLTKGTFSVNAIHSDVVSEAQLLDIAAAAESGSRHPVAISIVKAHDGHIDRSRVSSVREIAGHGVEAVIDGRKYFVGSSQLMEQANAEWHECRMSGTIIHIAEESRYLGHIVISDDLRTEAAKAAAELKKAGIAKTVMLTGDAEPVAKAVAEKVGVDEYRAQLLPEDKVAEVEKIIVSGGRPAFVGDGINDAPVLSRADVGVAMGAIGSDAAIESADVVLMDDKLTKLPEAISLSRRTMRIVRQNIVFALAVKAVILLLGALGIADMWIAVFGDVGVMILAILNAMRTLFVRSDCASGE